MNKTKGRYRYKKPKKSNPFNKMPWKPKASAEDVDLHSYKQTGILKTYRSSGRKFKRLPTSVKG